MSTMIFEFSSAFFNFMIGFSGMLFFIICIYERSVEQRSKNSNFMLALGILIAMSAYLALFSANAIGIKMSSDWNNYALVAGLVLAGIYGIADRERWKE